MPAASLTAEQINYRRSVRSWLASNPAPKASLTLPRSPREVMTAPQIEYFKAWQRRCYEAGLVGADIPTVYGGYGHHGCQAIANRELSRVGAPFLFNTVGLSTMIPAVLEHGSEDQKRRFIPGALSGKEIWCQSFSEGGAGCDMANQQTFAKRCGDEWVVNGHTVWASFGHFAQWMLLLARTGRDQKRNGLTFFLCPIAGHPGVTVKPLVEMTGQTGVSEVSFEDVVISDSLRLGAVGKGSRRGRGTPGIQNQG